MSSCPQCGSSRLYRDGLRTLNDGSTVQRWLCRSCGYRFSESNVKVNIASKVSKSLGPIDDSHKSLVVSRSRTVQKSANGLSFLLSEDVCSHNLSSVAKELNALPLYSSNAKYASKKAKNLSATESKTVAGDGRTQQEDVKGKMLEFAFHMTKEGLKQSTIATFMYMLEKLAKNGANLLDPESVKEVMAKLENNNSKATMKGAYSCFLKFIGKTWKPPKIQYIQRIPFIPLESELDALIAGTGKTTSCLLQLLKESGMRIGEALRLEWTDINTENNTIILNKPEKNSNPRICKVSSKLIGMIQGLPKKNERVFGKGDARQKACLLALQRKSLARKLGNPRLLRITFHTFRHWKGTMEYHKTHDPYHVKQILGHKSMKSTEIYINVEQAVFNEANDEFHVKVTGSLEEACKLLEVGFEYVLDMDGKKLFRKRK